MKNTNYLQQELLQRNFVDYTEVKNLSLIKDGWNMYYIEIDNRKYPFPDFLHSREEEKKILFLFKNKKTLYFETGIYFNEELKLYFTSEKLDDYLYETRNQNIKKDLDTILGR